MAAAAASSLSLSNFKCDYLRGGLEDELCAVMTTKVAVPIVHFCAIHAERAIHFLSAYCSSSTIVLLHALQISVSPPVHSSLSNSSIIATLREQQ